MIILGAGLAGCLAGMIHKNARILEPSDTIRKHQAVLRFRSDAVSKATGIPFQKVTVHKGIYDTDVMDYAEPNIGLCNQYSRKVTGTIANRSIWNLSTSERWLAPKDFHERMLSIVGERIEMEAPLNMANLGSDDLISTLPLFVTAEMVGAEFQCSTDYKSIYVTRCTIRRCDVHQTVYIPTIGTSYYRATIEGDQLIVESMEKIGEKDIDDILLFIFGIDPDTTLDYKFNMLQKIGKIPTVDNEIRKQFLWELTRDHNIYSLGRMACWRNILLDDVLQDIGRIDEMMAKSNYDLAIGAKK